MFSNYIQPQLKHTTIKMETKQYQVLQPEKHLQMPSLGEMQIVERKLQE